MVIAERQAAPDTAKQPTCRHISGNISRHWPESAAKPIKSKALGGPNIVTCSLRCGWISYPLEQRRERIHTRQLKIEREAAERLSRAEEADEGYDD